MWGYWVFYEVWRGIGNLKGLYYEGGRKNAGTKMRHERFTPMEYVNEQLMAEWNEFNIALKVWLHPGEFGDKLPDLQRRYPKPDLSEIDNMFREIMHALSKDSKPMIKY